MKRQEIIEKFTQKLIIENYSKQTIANYVSSVKLFLDYVGRMNVNKITDKEIQDYLFYCKTIKKYSFSSKKQVTSSIRYLYKKIFNRLVPDALNIKLRKPSVLHVVLTVKEISKLLNFTTNLKHN